MGAMLLLSSVPRSEHDPDPCSDLEAAVANTAAAANIAMHPVTGAFADPSVAELVARHVEQEVAHVLLSCARGQTNHQCQSAGVAGTAYIGVAATAIVPSAASIPLVAPRHQWHALSGDVARGGGVTSAPTPSMAPTHTPTSSVAAAAASHELTGSLGCNQSNTNCQTASDGVPTPEQALVLIARRDILVAEDQIHLYFCTESSAR